MQSNTSFNERETIKKAVEKYANENNIAQNEINQILEKTPDIKAKITTLSSFEIEELKREIGSERLWEIQKLLNSVK